MSALNHTTVLLKVLQQTLGESQRKSTVHSTPLSDCTRWQHWCPAIPTNVVKFAFCHCRSLDQVKGVPLPLLSGIMRLVRRTSRSKWSLLSSSYIITLLYFVCFLLFWHLPSIKPQTNSMCKAVKIVNHTCFCFGSIRSVNSAEFPLNRYSKKC